MKCLAESYLKEIEELKIEKELINAKIVKVAEFYEKKAIESTKYS